MRRLRLGRLGAAFPRAVGVLAGVRSRRGASSPGVAVSLLLLALAALLLQACSGAASGTSPSEGSGKTTGVSMPAGLKGSSAAVRCGALVAGLGQAERAVAKAAPGSTVCLKAGSYSGALSLNAKPAGYVTLTAAPGAHVETGSIKLSGSHLAISDLWIHGEVALTAGTSDIAIVHDDISNAGGAGGEGIVFETSDCTAPNAPKWEGCEAQAPISGVAILANHIHDIGAGASEDAIHLDNWREVRIEGNELDHVVESGKHTDCLQSVYGGEGLVFDRNYEHDNDCQGIFIKDGDASNVSVADNLFVRDEIGSYANFSQIWNVKGLTVEHNTIWDGKGLALVADEASFQPTATVERNLIATFTLEQPTGTPYAIAEGHNDFGQAPWSFKPSRTDRTVAHPRFVAPARGDYRLAHNRRGIGVDWTPAGQSYGPIS
ncbi:MAG: right-handed parallel beta-helix repeat-containing protein [Solirubrobacteraceae bacterium]